MKIKIMNFLNEFSWFWIEQGVDVSVEIDEMKEIIDVFFNLQKYKDLSSYSSLDYSDGVIDLLIRHENFINNFKKKNNVFITETFDFTRSVEENYKEGIRTEIITMYLEINNIFICKHISCDHIIK